MKEFKCCARCIMDNSSDDTITFDENGFCNYCTAALHNEKKYYFPNEEGEKKLDALISFLKNEGKNKKYDCIMGISGGLDSAYLAYLGAVKWGLRILAVHIDDGFDTEVATENIKNLVKKAGIELITIQPDAQQFNDLTRAYIYAEVPNLAIPQDNVLFSALYAYAKKHKIYHFLSGINFSLECILQAGNTYTAYDTRQIKDINKRFGTTKINKLPLTSPLQRKLNKVTVHAPLNYINYNKKRAIQELKDFSDFSYYGAKHLENKLTKVIQLVWFKQKFGVDKRTSHLSSLIISGQMTREEALIEYQKPLCDAKELELDISFVLQKLGIERQEFERIVKQPPKKHSDYKTSRYFTITALIKKLLLK